MADVIVYIDGFNLYYGAVRSRPECKWLNLDRLARAYLDPSDRIKARAHSSRISFRGT
jgi:hypothetical protein